MTRRFAQGAEVREDGTHFRVWAPSRSKVELLIEGAEGRVVPLEKQDLGYFAVFVPNVGAGARYRFRLDGRDSFPDPASRFQPDGPHGPSEVVDPGTYAWTDAAWKGAPLADQILYELHVGTFTDEGTWAAATEDLNALVELGVTMLEIMPIAEFPGKFGWGYDGVDWFAPAHIYGSPDDLRRFIDRAHALGLGVILDVVYNHIGPNGNYLTQFSPSYFTHEHATDWGDAINYDGTDAHGVRSLASDNAAYWVKEFHFDGLRLDATQNIYDSSKRHILIELSTAARLAAPGRTLVFVAENESQEAKLVRPQERGGYGLDGLWNDDFHHASVVVLAGHSEAYYTDYQGTVQELISALKYGYLYQGQRYAWQKARRGSASFDLPRSAFVTFLENHDQVSNSGDGARLYTKSSPARWRAMTALMLLGPGTPMLFQGQEFGSAAPFLYFADHEPGLAKMVREGRAKFLAQFPSLATPEAQNRLDDPGDPKTFERCRLDRSERKSHQKVLEMHKSLIALRKSDDRLTAADRFDGAVLGPSAMVLRWFGGDRGDLLAVMNIGADL
ncbi:MAG: malto-oligosyltrehalose trehalohydrolase, partial [Polyangiaceae bacterium]